MHMPAIRKLSLLEPGALPPDPRDFPRSMPPRIRRNGAPVGAPRVHTVQAPQSALGVHPCIALSSAAANTSLEDHRRNAKLVIVADREK